MTISTVINTNTQNLDSGSGSLVKQGDLSVSPKNKKLFIKSFGCQMNVYDAARMSDGLAPQGYEETKTADDADLIILNTCHIRERATEKIFSELGKMRVLKDARSKTGQETKIVVAGCVAQAEGAEIFRRQQAVDLVIGPQNYHRLPKLLAQTSLGKRLVDTDFSSEDKFDHLVPPASEKIRARGMSAFVTIQEGCDKFCTFCVVPYTRGAEQSRSTSQVLAEISTLAKSGVREVTLLGQNVNAWHGADEAGESSTLATLAAQIAQIPGIVRIRYSTSHPNDMKDDLIRAHQLQSALMPFLHLPVQSGSDRILAAMNRRHTARDYLDCIKKVRAACPDIAISSDFIVGFPGESETDFAETLHLIETVGFASAFYFKYSSRPGTLGADMVDQVPEPVKIDRLARLQALVEEQRRAFNVSMLGRIIDVLFEKKGRYQGQIAGKSPYMQPVQVDGPESLLGEVCRVKIVSIGPNSLFGELLRH